jgi:hypothetical protein
MMRQSTAKQLSLAPSTYIIHEYDVETTSFFFACGAT